MSAPKHTAEPWHAGGSITGNGYSQYIGANGCGVIGSIGDHDTRCGGLHVMYASRFYASNAMSQAHANAARIVACVNACKDMDDPGAIISGLYIARETLLTVAKQRDELAAALRDVIGWVPGASSWHTTEPLKAVERARAALSRVQS